MRLKELTGYKSHPIAKAASQLRPREPDETHNNSYHFPSMKAFTKVMADNNWRLEGYGKFSNVYRNKAYPFMVKVFVNDPAYLSYFKLVRDNQNLENVPKVRGKFMPVGTKAYAVRLEPLEEINGEADPIFKRYVDPMLEPEFSNLLDERNHDFLKEHHPEFFDLIDAITDIDSTLDWHTGNLLKRGNTLVISDPIAT